MSELFSSAWNYLSGGGGGGGGGEGNGGSRFVGQEVDMRGKVVKIKKVIAEGGYGYVFVAQDTQSGKEYALKRQVVAIDNVKVVKQEIAFLRQLRGHPHIIQLVAAAGTPPSHTSHGNAEFVILTELCSGGKLEDVVNSVRLRPHHVLRVFYATCCAVAHMHSQSPPIVHRDIKVENLLLTSDGSIKLCDFGSATTQHISPDHSWTATQRGLADEEIQRNTTPMYRAPEMIDLYSNHPINEKADIWALGCLLYKLCYQEHPFEDSAKLRILSANYKLPSDDATYIMFHNIIRACLQVDPSDRPSVDSIVAQLYGVADKLRVNFDQPSTELLEFTNSRPQTTTSVPSASSADPEADDGGSGQVHATLHSTGQQAQKLFGFMKDGAGNLFKKIKDSSSSVVQQVTSATQGSKKPPLDIAYITSRILAMSFPHEDGSHANSLQEVREFLETRHPSQYLVFNLSGHSYDTTQLNDQVADFAWPHKCMPDLEKLVDLCRNLDSWLRADKQNVIVLHCHDGRLTTALVVSAYLLFLNTFTNPLLPLRLFTFKRSLDIQPITAAPSQLRYLQYILDLVGEKVYKPHSRSVTINAIQMSSVPLFNAIKTGCKPFVEVFQDGERLFTSASHDTMEQIQSFTAESGGVLVPLGTKVRGNIQVIIHHIRAIPIARKVNLGMTAVRMFQFQFHTGFIPPYSSTLSLERQELDGVVAKKEDRFPPPFQVLLGLEWDQSEEPRSPGISWQNLPHPTSSPLPAFSSLLEQEETLRQFCDIDATVMASQQPSVAFYPASTQQQQQQQQQWQQHHGGESLVGNGALGKNGSKRQPTEPQPPPQPPSQPPQPPQPQPPPPQSAKAFFSQLDWQTGDSGYTAFADESESDSDESSSSSDEEEDEMFNQAGMVQYNSTGAHNHMPQVNGSSGVGGMGAGTEPAQQQPPTTSSSRALPTLIAFGSDSEEDEGQPPHFNPPPQKSNLGPPAGPPVAPQRLLFGDFDPWGPTATAQSMNLLDLEDNLSPPSDSEVSEVRTVGSEAFKKKSSSLRSSPAPVSSSVSPSSNQFDPFGAHGGGSDDFGGEMFGNPSAFVGHSSSSENLPKQSSARQSSQFDTTLLTPSSGSNSLHSSAPNVSALAGNNVAPFAPTLSNIPQFPRPGSHSAAATSTNAGLLGQRRHSAMPPTDHQSSAVGGGGGGGGGRTSPYAGGNLMTGANSPLGFHAHSTGHLQQQMGTTGASAGRGTGGRVDPFSDLGNVKLGSGNAGSSPRKSHQTPAQTGPSMTSRPGYQYYKQKQPPSSASQRHHQPPTSSSSAGSSHPRPQQSSSSSSSSSSYQPNYSSSVLGDRTERGPRSKTGVRQPPKRDDFSDLLNVQGFSKPDKGPRTLKDMKKESDIEGVIDPDRARVCEWADGKERNIRALISSLHTILWEGETRWNECGMHQLIQPDQVKKMYRKACLSVHPDKAQDTEHEVLARAIFDELNDAYARFEESGAQPLY